ncbi:hypothetical protein B6A10_11990 [Flavobacterium sp. L1I52]|uniref:Lipoprotein n=1 Tax=Flavobacterium pokkalii TaxID=1940408 RepID=A0ABR7UU41_9FLAO|nr:hypothetical protein [Flavobacterium pokkalii]MBD0725901.1 hypothetical protein [Flavobacterium pokkalii]
MKKIVLSLLTLAIFSCTTENETTTSDVAASNLSAKVSTSKNLITAAELPTTNYSLTTYESCSANCIEAGSAIYFEKTNEQTVSWGGPNNDKFSKTVYIKYFNTLTDFKILVLSTEGFSDLIINGIETGIGATANTWGEYSLPLGTTWNTCDIKNFNVKVAGNGPQAEFNTSYGLVGKCESTCSTSFTGKSISCDETREVEYTFTSKDDVSNLKIQGGLTNFTGEDAVVTITGGNLTHTQRIPGGEKNSNRIITIEGSVKACETITINIKWNSSNSGGIITGSWSAGGTGVSVDPVAGLECQN